MYCHSQKSQKNIKLTGNVYVCTHVHKTYMVNETKKIAPNTALWDTETPKMPLSSFCVGHLQPCVGPALLRVIYTVSETLLEKTKLFLCRQLSVWGCFWVRDGGLCPLPVSALRFTLPIQVQTCASPVHVASLYELIFASILLYWEGLVSMVPSIPSDYLILFLSSLLRGSLRHDRGELMETSSLCLEFQGLRTLHIVQLRNNATGSFCHDCWTRHWSLSIAECC